MTSDKKRTVCIGIPCFQSVPAETLDDYMRFAFYLGRRMTEFDFFLAIKSKSEQFRARNAIFTAAAQMDADFLLMLDDDQVIDWENSQHPTTRYNFLRKLIAHMDADPKIGIVGALYYHRGGECLPVLMKEGKDGGYYYMRDDEITHDLQPVAVQGGGVMLCRMDMMLKLDQPIFAPEFQYGTDIQVCQKCRDAGYKVMSDTGIVLGHVKVSREVVTPENRVRIMAESTSSGGDRAQFDPVWQCNSAYHLYYLDAIEYMGLETMEDVTRIADEYQERMFNEFPERLEGVSDEEWAAMLSIYYLRRGRAQLARQVWFHGSNTGLQNDSVILSMFKGDNKPLYGLDFGCGSSPVGFELVLRGHQMDMVDVKGAAAYEFVKWRAKKREVEGRIGWEMAGPYDFILALDSLEHMPDAAASAVKLGGLLKRDGILITNYFVLNDTENPEHISMDRDAVKKALLDMGIFPVNPIMWINRDLAFMDRRE